MRFIAGIDGGGTKTSLLCRDIETGKCCHKIFGPFNLGSIGAERFLLLLRDIRDYMAELGKCEAICIGTAGVSNESMQDMIYASFNVSPDKIKLVGDHEIALCGALDNSPGIIVISGTGSICFGKNTKGELCRAGGWGHLIGDGGSAYGLGRDMLAAVADEIDGSGAKTRLTELLEAKNRIKGRVQIISYVYGNDKTAVASLAPLVEEASGKGDVIATAIIEKNADMLVKTVDTVYKKLCMKNAEVAMSGGLLENGTVFKKAFINRVNALKGGLTCIEKKKSAAEGALLLAEEILS